MSQPQNIDPRVFVKRIMDEYPDEMCHLTWDRSRPWTLLFAVILSAQCTDDRVNIVTPVLFKRFPDLEAFVARPREELENTIKSTGFYRAKANHLHTCATQLLEHHNGVVPDTMEDLTSLRGEGRKTANVIPWNSCQKNVGFVVDTHVLKISRRTGLSPHKDPIKTERALMKKLPQDYWGRLSHMLVQFGRDYCKARKPRCSSCPLEDVCPRKTL